MMDRLSEENLTINSFLNYRSLTLPRFLLPSLLSWLAPHSIHPYNQTAICSPIYLFAGAQPAAQETEPQPLVPPVGRSARRLRRMRGAHHAQAERPDWQLQRQLPDGTAQVGQPPATAALPLYWLQTTYYVQTDAQGMYSTVCIVMSVHYCILCTVLYVQYCMYSTVCIVLYV